MISTDQLVVRYREGSGPFNANNLVITWKDKAGAQSWRPGQADDGNLLGVPMDKDFASQHDPILAPGPLSRNGYFLLDDSGTAVWDKTTEWVKPRVDGDGQDWYFFLYGQDYAHALGELSTLLGPIPMVPRYMLGTWFSSRAGYSGEEWKMNVERFREESIPLDVLALDSDSWTKGIWAGYDWDLEQIPDPKGFIQWMRTRGIRVNLNEHWASPL